MASEGKIKYSALRTPIIIMAIFWIIGIVMWQTTDGIFYLFNFRYIGTIIFIGAGLHSALPKKKKEWGRRFTQLLIGGYILVFVGLVYFENMQIEGFFFYLLAGFIAGSVLHYLIAKIVGPFIFNRAWCGWCCWTAMILDFLPYYRNKKGRLPTKWGNLRYIHFALSLALVLTLWFGFDYRVQSGSATELYWLIGGNALYYITAIPLAFILKDNRAFCKYLCPITAVLKVTSHFAMLKIAGDIDKCNDCGACNKICPMDIRITDYIKNGQRVLSTECIICELCINVCSRAALKLNWGFDYGKQELLNKK